MVFSSNPVDSLIVAFTYLFVYNFSFISVFWTIQNFSSVRLKTLYSFKELKFNFFFLSLIVLTFFSLAGVPPFVGFFSKILIFLNLINSNFFFFFLFFFIILFFGLYFYIQNMKFLLSNNNSPLSYSFNFNVKFNRYYFVFAFISFFVTVFGFFFFDDFLFYVSWLLLF